MQYANERVEYKFQLADDIYKEIIAFANTDGGVIYISVDDQGNAVGIENVDETSMRPAISETRDLEPFMKREPLRKRLVSNTHKNRLERRG